jgi:hypothetical protein
VRPEVAPFQKSLPQLRSVVHLAISAHPLGAEAPAREALTALREMHDRPDVRSRASTAIRIVEAIEANDITPEGFADAIKFGGRRANIQPHDLAKRSGAGWKLHDWLSGRSAPDRFSSFGHVQAIERLLGFKPGTLWDRVRFRSAGGGRIPKGYWPDEIPKSADIKGEIKLYLPDDVLTRPEVERRDIFLAAYAVVLVKRERHLDENHAANCADRYRHNRADWTASFAGEVDSLFKSHSFKPKLDLKAPKNGKLWVQGTKERNTGFIAKFSGVMLRQGTSDREGLTLALFANPTLASNTVEFAVNRRTSIEVEDIEEPVKPYEAEDIQFLIFGKMLVAKGGFLRLRPEFYDKLSPRAQAMLAEEFPNASDWNAICDAAFDRYEHAIEQIEQWIKDLGPRLSRAKARIVLILSNDLHDFRAAFGAVLAARLKKYEVGYRGWAYATQNLVYHEMVAQYPHRSRVIRETVWKADHTGSVRCVKGRWEWHTHWTSVKNARSSDHFLDHEWHKAELKDINGLYAALHDYTRPDGARDWILNGRSSDRFLVQNSDEPEFDASQLYAKVARSTRAVLAKINDPRWSEARCFGPHAERKIGFNAQLEPVDSPTYESAFRRACGVLLVGERTANKYYRFSPPEDRAAGAVEKLDRERKWRG